MDASSYGVTLVIPPLWYLFSNFQLYIQWGGRLPKGNGGAQRYTQHVWKSCNERNGISVLDCETYTSNR